jgi:hypothetical protein
MAGDGARVGQDSARKRALAMQTLTLAFIAVAVLAGMTALARRATPPGPRRNVLSVVLVVLAFLAVFLLCFALGSLARAPA